MCLKREPRGGQVRSIKIVLVGIAGEDELDVVGIRGGAAADQARLCGHKSQMVAIALTYRFADDSDFPRTRLALPQPAALSVCLPLLRRRHRR